MKHLRGLPREQKLLLPEAVEDYVSAEAPVRFIHAFVGTLESGFLTYDLLVC